MNWIRDKLSQIGIFLAAAGLLSTVLQLFNYELRIFRAIDARGPGVAWGIRIGFIVVGALLFFVADRGEKVHAGDEWTGYRQAAAADPRMAAFLEQVKQKLGVTAAQIPHWVFMAQDGQVLPAGDPRALYMIAYVDAPAGKSQMSQNLQTGEIAQTALSGMQWGAVVH
jgi:hypothetical protein